MAEHAPAVEVTEEQQQRLAYRRAMSRKKRIEREQEGEISELNLTAMMDMMTIILVFLLKSFSSSAIAMTSSEDIKPPVSTTRQTPKDAVPVTITSRSILVKEKEVARLENGLLPAEQVSGRVVLGLDAALKTEVKKLKQIADFGGGTFSGEMAIIADKRVPYTVLTTVLYTAGMNELDKYRFVVLQKEEAVASAPTP